MQLVEHVEALGLVLDKARHRPAEDVVMARVMVARVHEVERCGDGRPQGGVEVDEVGTLDLGEEEDLERQQVGRVEPLRVDVRVALRVLEPDHGEMRGEGGDEVAQATVGRAMRSGRQD